MLSHTSHLQREIVITEYFSKGCVCFSNFNELTASNTETSYWSDENFGEYLVKIITTDYIECSPKVRDLDASRHSGKDAKVRENVQQHWPFPFLCMGSCNIPNVLFILCFWRLWT